MKIAITLSILVLLALITLSCSKVDETKSKANEEIDTLLPLKIFGEASVTAQISDKTIKENNIATKVTIKEINTHGKAEQQEPLLEKGDNMMIEFTGIGDKANWKINNAEVGSTIQVDLRCLDGRVNSLEQFTKQDCYWEGADETVIIEQ